MEFFCTINVIRLFSLESIMFGWAHDLEIRIRKIEFDFGRDLSDNNLYWTHFLKSICIANSPFVINDIMFYFDKTR